MSGNTANSDDTHGSISRHDDETANRSPRQPTRSDSISHLNPRSCVTCRRRKVRCDKKYPCSNCGRQGIECIFPGPGRAPRKARKPPDTELLSRLRRLEGVVKSLGIEGVVGEDGAVTYPRAMSTVQDQLSQYSGGESPEPLEGTSQRTSIDKSLGRLVVNEGRSRYVSNQFWTCMGDEIAEMRDILDAPSSEDEDELYASPQQSSAHTDTAATSHQSFVFGYSSTMANLRTLHPSPSQVFILWEVFKENVDPLVRILHRPTAKNILIKASSSSENLSKAAEALLFAIYLGAVVSLEPSHCQSLLGESKEELVKRYRFATEQALARAGFLNSSSLMVLQAFVFFLVCVRYQDDTRLVWSLSGLAIHLAQALGVHRDGTNFGLSPFDTEMRRRLWWHISLLDTRSSEDHGTDPTFSDHFYDTKLPMNLNDDDLHPDMKEWPKVRQGCTEMTFCLVRFELSLTTRQLNFIPPGANPNRTREQTLETKEKIIDECHKRIEDRYLQYCDMNVPIFWVCATVGRLVLAKLWLMAHHPFLFDKSQRELSDACRERLFVTSVEVIEFSYLLERNESTAKWGWLFRTYMQWHAVTFVLSELCVRPLGPQYERAWKAIESVYDERVLENPRNHKGMLWKPMRQLMTRAKARREILVSEQFSSSIIGREMNHGPQEGSHSPNTIQTPEPLAPKYPLTTLQSSADAFGLEMNEDLYGRTAGPVNDLEKPRDVVMSQPTMSEEEIQAWLSNEQMMQQTPDLLDWSSWNPGVGDFTLGGPHLLNDFTVNGQQQWT